MEGNDLVYVSLNGLGKMYHQFWISIGVHETFLHFQKMIALLISEEQINGSSHSRGKSYEIDFYSNSSRTRETCTCGCSQVDGMEITMINNSKMDQNHGGG